MKPALNRIIVVMLILLCFPLLMGADFMYWRDNFSPITLQNIGSRGQVCEGSSQVTLFTNGDAEISADNSTAAQLSFAGDTLVTEYKLTFDGNGSDATGGTGTNYETYDRFLLTTPAHVTHRPGDDEVEVILHVKASNYANGLANAGTYKAKQTLTVHWVGP